MDAFLHVYRKNWMKNEGLDLKVVDQSMFIFYFEEASDLEFFLRRALWSFDNGLIFVQQIGSNMSPSFLSFDFNPVWVQIHDLLMDWRSELIIRKIMCYNCPVLEVDKFSLTSGSMKLIRVQISFDITKVLFPRAWIPCRVGFVWFVFKYERLPGFCYYCGRITHNSWFCEAISDVSIKFDGKYAQFCEWLRPDMNMKVPMHIN